MWSVVTTWRVSVIPKPYCGIRASSEMSSVFRNAGTRSTAAYLPNTLHPPLLPYRFPGSHPRRTGITGASLDDQYRLAARGAGLEPLVSSAYVVEREALLGRELDPARLVHRPHLTRHQCDDLGLALQRAEPEC